MVSSSGCQFNSKEAVEFPCEFRNELRAPVRNYLSQKPMQFSDMCEEQAGRSEGSDCSMRQNEVGHLTHRIHNVHDHVITMSLWEFNDEVDADGVPMELWNREWS